MSNNKLDSNYRGTPFVFSQSWCCQNNEINEIREQ